MGVAKLEGSKQPFRFGKRPKMIEPTGPKRLSALTKLGDQELSHPETSVLTSAMEWESVADDRDAIGTLPFAVPGMVASGSGMIATDGRGL